VRVSWFGLKHRVNGFPVWASKPAASVGDLGLKITMTVSRFGPQNRQLRFGDLCLKITMTVSWVGPQNQADDGLSVVPQNQWEEDSVGHVSRSSGLLHLEASWDSISQFASKLAEE
jgi:hypothetical protein